MTYEEEAWLLDLLDGGRLQVDLARLAGERATDEQVRALAARLLHEHTQLVHMLPVPSAAQIAGMSGRYEEYQGHRQRVWQAHGADFDRAYLDAALAAQGAQVAAIDALAGAAAAPLVQAFVSRAQPLLHTGLYAVRQAHGTS